MRAYRRARGCLGSLILLLTLLLPTTVHAAEDAGGGGALRWWTVPVGAAFPARTTINAGDIVEWRLDGPGARTVTFLAPDAALPALRVRDEDADGRSRPRFNPLVVERQGGAVHEGTAFISSGQLGGGRFPRSYRLTFSRPGEFVYLNLFQPGMRGLVVVQPAGSPRPLVAGRTPPPAP